MNLHVMLHHGRKAHHIAEGIFKATARALRMAVEARPADDRRAEHEGHTERVAARRELDSHRAGWAGLITSRHVGFQKPREFVEIGIQIDESGVRHE